MFRLSAKLSTGSSLTVKRWISSTSLRCYPLVVPFTADRYPVSRGKYAELTDEDLSVFRSVLGKENVVTNSDDLEGYNVDWLKICRGQSKVVLRPKETEQVSEIMKHCNSRKLAVCPQGGNTGLVGGSVSVFDEIVLSMSQMNKLISLDKTSGVAVSQAGMILENLENHAAEKGLVVPLDLGAKGSCHIGAFVCLRWSTLSTGVFRLETTSDTAVTLKPSGLGQHGEDLQCREGGNVATNAGGLRLLRYGSLHSSVLGLEVVLADGTILPMGTNMRKDNTGYHLHHLFIGSEGTLGVITKVALLCPPRPTSVSLCILGLKSFEDVLKCYETTSRTLTDILSAFEFMDRDCYMVSCEEHKISPPLGDFPFYVMIEIAGWTAETDSQRLSDLLVKLMETQDIDGTVADEPSRIKTLWSIREGIAEATARRGYCYKYDLSIPKRQMYQAVEDLKTRLSGSVIFCAGYGHLGDNNLHLNILSPDYDPKVAKLIEPYVFEWTSRNKGSISAEHGLGFKKRNAIYYSQSPAAVNIMKNVKRLFDPNGILSPYKVLPDEDVGHGLQ